MRTIRIKTALCRAWLHHLRNSMQQYQKLPFLQKIICYCNAKSTAFEPISILIFSSGLVLAGILLWINVLAIDRTKLHSDRLTTAMSYLDEIDRINKIINSLEQTERPHESIGDNLNLERADGLRQQLQSSLGHLLAQPLVWIVWDNRPPASLRTETMHRNPSIYNFSLAEVWSRSSTRFVTQHFENPTPANHRETLLALSESVKHSVRLQIDQYNQQQNYRSLGSIALVLTAAIFFAFFGFTPRHRTTNDQRHIDTHTAASESAMGAGTSLVEKAARASERAIIARDIHDELGALLMTVKIDMKRLSKNSADAGGAVDARWVVILERIDTAMYTVTRIAETLNPHQIDHIGFWLVFENYIKDYQATMDIPCYLRFDTADRPPLPLGTADDIFRIVQEALTNVARHAKATQIEIEVRKNDAQIEITIADNGAGIAPVQLLHPHSAGIAGMFYRARQHGCELTMRRQLAGGTLVQIRTPLPRFQ